MVGIWGFSDERESNRLAKGDHFERLLKDQNQNDLTCEVNS